MRLSSSPNALAPPFFPGGECLVKHSDQLAQHRVGLSQFRDWSPRAGHILQTVALEQEQHPFHQHIQVPISLPGRRVAAGDPGAFEAQAVLVNRFTVIEPDAGLVGAAVDPQGASPVGQDTVRVGHVQACPRLPVNKDGQFAAAVPEEIAPPALTSSRGWNLGAEPALLPFAVRLTKIFAC